MQLEGYSVARACELAQVSRAGFYRHWEERAPKQMDNAIRDAMQRIALQNRCLGYRRIKVMLQAQGFHINHKKLARMLREDNLLSLRRRPFVVTTDSQHAFTVFPNLARGMILNGINQLWVSDITYIRMQEQFAFLAVILDAFSRRVIGWELDTSIDATLTLRALANALANRGSTPGIVHHSDRGIQYCCNEYVSRLEKHGFIISMSRRANPWDNARAESFMKTLKVEEVYLKKYRDLADAHENLKQFLEDVYNESRLHSALDYQSPAQFEASLSWKEPK